MPLLSRIHIEVMKFSSRYKKQLISVQDEEFCNKHRLDCVPKLFENKNLSITPGKSSILS